MRRLGGVSFNVGPSTSEDALGAATRQVGDAQELHTFSFLQQILLRRQEEDRYGGDYRRSTPSHYKCQDCRRGSSAYLSTSVDSSIASTPDLEGEGELEAAQESSIISFRRKGGDRYARARSNTVVATLVKMLEGVQTTHDVEQILEQRSEHLLNWPWLLLLDALQKGPKPQLAMEVFNWKKNKLGCEANPKEYAKMISFAGRVRQLQVATDLFHEMEKRGVKKTAVTYNALIHAYGRNDDAQQALSLFEDMKVTEDCQPTLVTYNTLISMYSRLGVTEEMKKIFEACKEVGFSPDRHMYNALIWGYMHAGQLVQMEETFKELEAGECTADVITYNAQIIGYARANDVDKMQAAFTSMQKAGIPINAMVGEILVEVYSRTRMFDRMEETLKIMDATPGVQYGSRVHSMVIECYADAGQHDEMDTSIERMFQNKRMFATPRTLESIITAYAKNSAYDRLKKAMEVVKGSGWIFQVNIYNKLISEYGKGGRFDMMEQTFHELRDANMTPTAETYQIMVDAYDKGGPLRTWASQLSLCEMQFLIPKQTVSTFIACGLMMKYWEGRPGDFITLLFPDCCQYLNFFEIFGVGGWL